MGLFTPAWMKNDSKSEPKALAAVEKMMKQADLIRVAEEAPNWNVRKAAMKKVTDPAALVRIAVNDASLNRDAVERLTDGAALQYVVDNADLSAIRVLAASRLPDHARGQQIILDAALNDKEEAVRIQAVELLDDQSMLAQVAIHKGSKPQVVTRALSRITESRQFERVARETPHDSAREWALDRIADKAVQEEISRSYLVDPNMHAGFSAMRAALQYTDDQAALAQFVRREKVHEDLKIKAIEKITDVDFLNEIVRSDDEAFQFKKGLMMPGTSHSFVALLNLKSYAEARLRALGKEPAAAE